MEQLAIRFHGGRSQRCLESLEEAERPSDLNSLQVDGVAVNAPILLFDIVELENVMMYVPGCDVIIDAWCDCQCYR